MWNAFLLGMFICNLYMIVASLATIVGTLYPSLSNLKNLCGASTCFASIGIIIFFIIGCVYRWGTEGAACAAYPGIEDLGSVMNTLLILSIVEISVTICFVCILGAMFAQKNDKEVSTFN